MRPRVLLLLLAGIVLVPDLDGQAPKPSPREPLPPGASARLGGRRFRHEDAVHALLFAPYGKALMAYTDSGVFIWDAATRLLRHRLPALMPYSAAGMDISPDGSILALAEYSREQDEAYVGLWDARAGKRLRALRFPRGEGTLAPVRQVRFSADGKTLAVGRGNKGNALVFDVATGKLRASLAGLSSIVYQIALTPDGKNLALAVARAARAINAVQVWDIAGGKMVRTIRTLRANGREGEIGALAFSPDGGTLAIGINDQIYLHDTATGEFLRQLARSRLRSVTSLAFTAGGKQLIAASASNAAVATFDIATGQIVHAFEGGTFEGRALAVTPDARTVVLATAYGFIRLWDLATGKELLADDESHNAPVHSLAFAPDGKTLASAAESGQVFLWDVPGKRRGAILPGEARSLMFSPDGKRLALFGGASTEAGGQIRQWDVRAAKPAGSMSAPKGWKIQAAAYALDGRKLFTEAGRVIREWEIAAGRVDALWTLPVLEYAQLFARRPNRGRIGQSRFAALAADGNTFVDVWDSGDILVYVALGRRVRLLPGAPEDTVLAFAPSPDGRLLATGMWEQGQTSAVRMIEVVTGKQIQRMPCHGGVTALAWSSDGRFLASGELSPYPVISAPDAIRIWDAATGSEVARFGNFNSRLTAVAFSRDGRYLAAALRDSSILILDVANALAKAKRTAKLTPTNLEALWLDLAQADAARAHAAIGRIVAGADDSVAFLKPRLKPVDGGKINRWIKDLNSAKYSVRQAAAKELTKIGEEAKGIMHAALKKDLPLETYRRITQMLAALPEVPPLPDTVRAVRAITALERIGSPSAQAVLRNLASGAPGARTTEEAEASLKRLANAGI